MVKNPLANAGDIRDMGLIPGSGRFAGGGHGNPTPVFFFFFFFFFFFQVFALAYFYSLTVPNFFSFSVRGN